MVLRKTSTPKYGFTLLEVVIVVGLLLVVASLGLFVSMSDYRSFHFHNERDRIISALQKARSQAISNICFGIGCTDGKSHGVYFGTVGSYLIFQGTDYGNRDVASDEVIEAKDSTATISGFDSVVFSALSGKAVSVGGADLTVRDVSGKTSVISISPEGRISWSN